MKRRTKHGASSSSTNFNADHQKLQVQNLCSLSFPKWNLKAFSLLFRVFDLEFKLWPLSPSFIIQSDVMDIHLDSWGWLWRSPPPLPWDEPTIKFVGFIFFFAIFYRHSYYGIVNAWVLRNGSYRESTSCGCMWKDVDDGWHHQMRIKNQDSFMESHNGLSSFLTESEDNILDVGIPECFASILRD